MKLRSACSAVIGDGGKEGDRQMDRQMAALDGGKSHAHVVKEALQKARTLPGGGEPDAFHSCANIWSSPITRIGARDAQALLYLTLPFNYFFF